MRSAPYTARIARVRPPELASALPGPHRSSSVTCAPERRRCKAAQPPNAAAPATATRGWDPPAAPRRPANGAAARPARKSRRDRVKSESDACADSDGAGLIRHVTDARAEAALAIERETRLLVREVVHEERRIPLPFQNAEADIHDVVRRQLRIERERVLRQRPADRSLERRQADRRRASQRFIADLREAVADMLIDAAEIAHHVRHRNAIRR